MKQIPKYKTNGGSYPKVKRLKKSGMFVLIKQHQHSLISKSLLL